MDLGIKGKTAIVCAASKGLGKGCALALAREGVDLVIAARGKDALEAAAAEIKSTTGAKVTAQLVKHLQTTPLAADTIININIPDLPYEAMKGYRVTRLGYRHKAEPVVRSTDPRGRTIYWVGPAGAEQDAGPGTDFHAVREGYVAVTPLQIDLTRHAALSSLTAWIGGVER